MVTFLLTVTLVVFVQGERIQAQDRSDDLSARIERAADRQRSLRVQLAGAESPERILSAAADRGLVDPGPVAAVPPVPIDAPAPPDGAGAGLWTPAAASGEVADAG